MKLKSKLTYANVMSTIAAFGVLAGGGAYAAAKITARDIAPNAVTASKIKPGSVRASALKRPQVRSASVQASGADSRTDAIAACRSGEALLAGGGGWADGPVGTQPTVAQSAPAGNSWVVRGSTPGPNTLFASAICLPK